MNNDVLNWNRPQAKKDAAEGLNAGKFKAEWMTSECNELIARAKHGWLISICLNSSLISEWNWIWLPEIKLSWIHESWIKQMDQLQPLINVIKTNLINTGAQTGCFV